MLCAFQVEAEFETGRDLLSDCESEDPVTFTYCIGYISGMVDAELFFQKRYPDNKSRICMDGNVTLEQLWYLVTDHLNEHPADLHFTASSLVIEALIESFPCGN